MAQVVHTPAALRALTSALPGDAAVILVPTMGALHAGHLSLVKHARDAHTRGDCVIVSIYVNPLQFAPHEDFADYPRRLADDCDKLAGQADIIYAPDDTTMYPEAQTVGVRLPPLADELCGASRPGFFQGVAAAVCKLFNHARPDIAVFGAKDYQQAHIVRLMARQLGFPVAIEVCPTVREADGLAVSSRNEYLSAEARRLAPALYAALQATAAKITGGQVTDRDWAQLCQDGANALTASGLRCDYFAIRAADLTPPRPDADLVILAAAWAEQTRLIDNITVAAPPESA